MQRVLIVDDEPVNRAVLSGLLEGHYNVTTTDRGETALFMARRSPQPDLILLDVMMDGMDGYEVLRRLQADELTRDIPVMFLTALDDRSQEERGLELGATDYLTKPVHPGVLMARVRTQLLAKQGRDWLRDQNAALNAEVAEGALAMPDRNDLLARMTDDVAHLVLEDNRLQTLALSIAERGGADALPAQIRLIESFEAAGRLDRVVEGLASNEELLRRAADGFVDFAPIVTRAHTPQAGDAVDDLPAVVRGEVHAVGRHEHARILLEVAVGREGQPLVVHGEVMQGHWQLP